MKINKFIEKKIGINYSLFYLKNLKNGIANIIANFIKKISLNQIKGFCVYKIIFKNIKNEISYIKGIKEDIIDIVLNIKNVIFKIKNNKTTFFLKNYFLGPIYAYNIKTLNKNIKILNPSHLIANAIIKTKLNILIKVKKGKGYINNNEKKKFKYYNKEKKKIVIYLDTNYTPVKKFFFKIKKKIIKKKYEDLKIYIKTNGILKPKKIIKKSLNIFIKKIKKINI
ncbi:putative DNA-directed RNA polymerase, alpha subunit [Candidatus Zinderia insecticola CARI]|uniref:Putative DNA-directed RNA polymerase, alpha subunit n=1 Tax=Zinderia insecticola (strain CARI) TaxID=871271 RepID=E0TJ23_ZINIC|nr:putative DNA-directed RNA polymerase, alpha subunit [Candidatus Zinderia insecticola CARI]